MGKEKLRISTIKRDSDEIVTFDIDFKELGREESKYSHKAVSQIILTILDKAGYPPEYWANNK